MNSRWMLRLSIGAIVALQLACSARRSGWIFSGNFEAQEIVVSAEANGGILRWYAREGDRIERGDTICEVDSVLLVLQLDEVKASLRALAAQLPEVGVQTAALEEQVAKMEREKARTAHLVAAGVSTQKQLDDVQAQLAVAQRSLQAMRSSLSRSADHLLAQMASLKAKQEQLLYHIAKCRILAPCSGRVLQVYARRGELCRQGAPLVRIADLSELTLRVYLPYEALSRLSVGDTAAVHIDSVANVQSRFVGHVAWVANEAEFTPKSVQSRDMRNELVYAVKVRVPNTHGLLKRGMYGEIRIPETD